MAISNLDDLFVHLLKDIYYAEKQIIKSLPDLIGNAGNADLKKAFEDHKAETETQIERLETVFDLCGEAAKGEKCPAIEGILKETKELMDEVDDASTLDAAMIAAAQAVEHYEITRYGTIISYAEQLGKDEVVTILRDTLAEEVAADDKLSNLAKTHLNAEAA